MAMATQVSLAALSAELAALVAHAGRSVVRVDDGTRLTACGVLWDDSGLVLTTSHGVERDEDLSVELADGSSLKAEMVGRDPELDIALLRAASAGALPLQRPSGAAPDVGSLVLVVSRPGRLGLHAAAGIVSARRDTQTGGKDEYLLHTSVPAMPGSSGAAVLDASGRLIGMANMLLGRGRTVAVGLPVLESSVSNLAGGRKSQRGYLGVRTQEVLLPPAASQAAGGQTNGLLVMQVEPGSAAERCGLMFGDTLLALDNQTLDTADRLRSLLRGASAGAVVALRLLRAGALTELQATLGIEP